MRQEVNELCTIGCIAFRKNNWLDQVTHVERILKSVQVFVYISSVCGNTLIVKWYTLHECSMCIPIYMYARAFMRLSIFRLYHKYTFRSFFRNSVRKFPSVLTVSKNEFESANQFKVTPTIHFRFSIELHRISKCSRNAHCQPIFRILFMYIVCIWWKSENFMNESNYSRHLDPCLNI